MAESPYKILGVPKSADTATIRKAYRKLAKELHPDVRPNDKVAEDRFKQASAAFALLNNKEERAKYDRGEIDENGNPKGPFAGARPGPQAGGYQGGFAPGGFDDISDILSELFGRQAGMGARQPFSQRGEDMQFNLAIELTEAIKGGVKHVRMADGRSLKIKIPAGVQSGKSLRLKGQGTPGRAGGPPGDAIVEIRVKPHKFYVLDGLDLRVDLPISLPEAVKGAKVKVPTPDGAVNFNIPANTSSGRIFRLKGKGGAGPRGKRGDLLLRTLIVLPEKPSKDLQTFIKEHPGLHQNDLRDSFFS
jgi:DnaJ-class molecular chaperone